MPEPERFLLSLISELQAPSLTLPLGYAIFCPKDIVVNIQHNNTMRREQDMAILEEPIKEVMKLQNYIDGEWVESESDQILDVVNPTTQKALAKVPMSTSDEANAAVKAAKEAFPEWRRTTPLARVRCLFRLKELLEENFEELSRVQTMEHGKTIDESRGETRRGIEMVLLLEQYSMLSYYS